MSDMQFWKPHDNYEFDIGFFEFKMADIIFWKPNDFRGTLHCRAFGVADYEFDIGFPFFEMAYLIWRS